MKTAISVPDPLFHAAEDLVRTTRLSRSELYSRALREYLARHSPDAVTDAYDRVLETVEESPTDRAFQDEAARQVLGATEW